MKRTLALLMALLLFLTSTAPTAKVFAQGDVPETGGDARFKTILEAPNPTVEKGKEGTLPSNGGDIHILYNSHNVKDTDMDVQVLKGDVLMPYTFTTVLAHDDQGMHGVEFSGKLPANDTTKDVVYKFYIKEKADEKYDASNVITITVKAKNTATSTLTKVNPDNFTFAATDTARSSRVNLFGSNLTKDNIAVSTTKTPADAPDIKWGLIAFDSTQVSASAWMPEAPEKEDIIYKTTFTAEDGTKQTVTMIVKAKSADAPTEKTLTGMTIEPTSLPKTGGDVVITLQGENLEPTDITPSIFLKGEGPKDFPITWTKVSDGLKTKLNFGPNNGTTDQVYLLKFSLVSDPLTKVNDKVTVTTEDGPVAPVVPTVKGLIADPTSLPTAGGNVALNVIAENAKAGDIQWTVKKDGTPVSDPTPVAKDDRNFTLALPENDTKNDVVYTVEAKTANDPQGKSANITVAKKTTPPVVKESKIVMIKPFDGNIPNTGEKKSFDIVVSPKTDPTNVKLRITADDKVLDNIDYSVTGDGLTKAVTINFPKNKKASPVVYKVTFNATGSDTVFQDDPVATFTQAAGQVVNASISSVTATNDQLPLAGGDTKITIKGTDLDKAELVTKLFKVENGTETEVTLGNYMKGSFIGRGEVQSASFTFPKVDSDTEFVFKASVDGTNFVEKAILQTSEGSTRETEALEPKKVFTIHDDTLVVDFHEPVEEARANAIMKNVHILAGSETINISASDKVSFDGNSLQIKFDKPIFKDKKAYKLIVDARTFKLFNEKENREKENKPFESIIQKDGPYIEDATFVQGYKLESEGGKVVLKLTGYNLPDNLKVRIRENNKEKTELKEIPIKIEGSPNERTITFTAPANTTDRVQSYSVLVSTDGVQYSSEVSNMQNRFRRMVVSVLPKNADADAPQIDFMQIQSYGNAEEGDITHTNLPTGQESKKTLVWIYGANLNANHTRLRLIDKNGVYWSPIYDATQDSGNRILMTMLDGINGGTPGMTGEGNNMLMEVILPRGYQPDNWEGYEEGTTFRYEVAPDGVNFDSEVTVTATVRFDGEKPKTDIDKELTKVTVRHVDKDGKDIVPAEKVKAYNHLHPCDLQMLLPLRDKDGFKKEFKGYKVADTNEIVQGKTGLNDYGPAYYDGKTVKELKNSNGEIVLVYGKTEKPVDPSNPSDPTNPSNPSTPSKPDSPSDTGSGNGYFILPSTPTNNGAKPEEKPAPTTGYIKGYPDHTFRPAKSMTRAEAAAILARLCKLTGMDSTKPDFKDADGWYNAAINDVVKVGYMKGYPDGSFKPDQPITRAEFAAILSHVLKDTTAPNPFKDTAGHWAKDAIDKAYAQGIIKGYGDNSFRPDALVSRAEAVAMANRTFRLQKTVMDNPFTDITSDHWAYNDILTAVSNK